LAQRRGQELAMTPCRTRNPRFAVAQDAGRGDPRLQRTGIRRMSAKGRDQSWMGDVFRFSRFSNNPGYIRMDPPWQAGARRPLPATD